MKIKKWLKSKIPSSFVISIASLIIAIWAVSFLVSSQNISLIGENTQRKILEPLLKSLDLIYFSLYFYPNKLEKYELYYNEQDFSQLEKDLPRTLAEELERELTTRPSINGIFVANGEKYNVEISIRGEALANYINKKKTLGIKFKDEPFGGRKAWNFVVPEQRRFNSVGASEFIAKRIGILTQQWDYKWLRINGEQMGVYEMVDQIDTSFLEMNKLSPNDLVFKEDRRQAVISGDPQISAFSQTGSWDIDNNPQDPHISDFSAIENLKEIYKLNGPEFQNRIKEIVDIDQFLKWSALLYLLNDQHQTDYNNIRLIFLKEKGQFWFIPSHIFVQPITQIIDKVHRHSLNEKIISDPVNFWKRNEILRSLIFDPNFEKDLMDYLNKKTNTINAPIYQDSTKAFRYRTFKKMIRDQNRIIQTNIKTIKSYFELYEISSYSQQLKSGENPIIHTKINASIFFQPTIDRIFLYFDQIPSSSRVRAYFDTNQNLEIDTQDILITSSQTDTQSRVQEIKIDKPIIATSFNNSPYEIIRPIATANILIETEGQEKLNDVKVTFLNPTTGRKLNSSNYFIIKNAKASEIPSFIQKTSPSQYLIRSGSYTIGDDLYIPEGELVIEAGTKFSLDPKTSIISKANIISKGTQTRPVIFTANSPNNHWGSLIIQSASKRSEFEYTQIEYGSGHSRNGIFATGALAAHFSDLLFQNSSISKSGDDDALNVKHAQAIAENSSFYQNFADHIDFDSAIGEVKNNSFNNEGIDNQNSDGIDLSFSKVEIRNNKFYKNVDKCVSVGENSQVNIYGNIMDSCNYGIAVKDAAMANIYNNTIKNNNIGIGTYQKKELYGWGGTANISGNNFEANGQDTKQEEKSKIISN